MNAKALEKRLRELDEYAEYFCRRELKVLAPLLADDEQLNCILTGVHEANRKMLAVTDRRLILIFAGVLGSGEVKVIARSAVTEYRFEKKLLFSSLRFTAKGEAYELSNTQGAQKELFEAAMKRPLTEPSDAKQ